MWGWKGPKIMNGLMRLCKGQYKLGTTIEGTVRSQKTGTGTHPFARKSTKGWERPRPCIMLGLCEISQQPTSMPAQLNTFGRAVSRPVNLINWGGKTITCSAEIDNSFVKHFSSLQSSATRSPKYPNQSIHNHLQIREDVLSKLHVSSPDTQNATGPDKSRQGFFKWPLHPYTPA